jgi:hypothetical protein
MIPIRLLSEPSVYLHGLLKIMCTAQTGLEKNHLKSAYHILPSATNLINIFL